MTIAEMRELLGLGPEVSDAAVAQAYAEYLDGLEAEPEDLLPLDLVKRHLELIPSETTHDVLLEAYRGAAISNLDGEDGWLGRSLLERTLVREFGSFDCIAKLPYPPMIEVLEIAQRGTGGDWVAVDPATYEVHGERPRLLPGAAWPSGSGAVRVRWRAGYSAADGPRLPDAIKAALLLMIGDLFAFRESAVTGVSVTKAPMSATVENLLSPFRVYA